MSRPARYGGKSYSHSQATPAEKSAYNQNGDTAAASALTKAHAQYNEPLAQLQAIFSDWKEDDLLSILEDTRGDVETAVARISEGHAEQWGAVKHKKDKKIPAASTRERERDRDGHVHSSLRGANSPRGRGRGGRGGNFRSGAPREHRERNTNGGTSPPSAAWGPEPGASATNGVAQEPVLDSTQNDGWDAAGQDFVKENQSTEPEPDVKGDSLESHPPSVEETKSALASVATPGTSKSRKMPASSGMSWAQIAKPQVKPLTSAPPPKAIVTESLPQQQQPQQDQHAAVLVTETGREAPTTVEAPSFDEEPAPTEPPTSQEAPADDWVNIPTPTAETETDARAQHLVEQLQEESSSQSAAPEPPVEPVVIPVAPESSDPVPISQIRQDGPETIAPPPGLASPAVSHHSASTPKPSTPSNSRPSYAARLSSRWKPDQAVLLPPTVGLGKSLPLQFGSLNLSEDSEPQSYEQPTTQELQPLEQRQAPQTLTTQPVEGHQNIPSASPARSFRAQTQPEAPAAGPEITGPPGISHTQAPSINPSLALAPGPSPTFPQQQAPQQAQSTASQHTLAGLAHTPQLPGQQSGLGHGQQQSFGQQSSFPQHQQQYESGGGIGISGTPLSGLAQPSQSQNQGFFRQTESPFYNQNQSQIPDHSFGNATSGFNQGPQAGFSGGPGLVNDFGYEGQRNPYESYASQGSFTGRGALRQDEVKGLAATSGTGLGMHHGQTQSVQLGGGQSTGSQNQGQYPSMTHLANPFYYNMNPYGYGNQFYSPAFTSFVNPMYQAGGNQTPPHNSKPGMAGATGLGVSGNGSYSSGNPGHLHHSSGGFESDAGPGGAPTYHQPSPALAGDFSKGVYGGGQGFLGNMGASTANNRGPGGGSVGPTPTSETSFKGYGGAAGTPASLGSQDKASTAQGVRGTPNVTQGQQQFYQNTRFPGAQSQGYPQQQGQNDYYPYQRW